MSQLQSDQDEISFVRTGDQICLNCVPSAGGHKRMALRAMAFGNRMCFLEDISGDVVCPDIASCVYVVEQAISIRALQERFNQSAKSTQATSVQKNSSKGSTHSFRTLLYGHAVLLRHYPSSLYLACLSSSTSSDKLAFDVGLKDGSEGEACWFTVHPASKQRSEGEKVRFNDDVILVSVFSERFLHAYMSSKDRGRVNASFRQQIWSLSPVASGALLMKNPGYLFGGDVVRLFHANMDHCITSVNDDAPTIEKHRRLLIKGSPSPEQACSLWRIEPFNVKWHSGFLEIGNKIRLRQVTTGEFLTLTPDENSYVITTLPHKLCSFEAVTFELYLSKDKLSDEVGTVEGFGNPEIKYGETLLFLRHAATGLWLSYEVLEVTLKGIGKVEQKRLIGSEEGRMDDCFKLVRAQREEARSASIIKICSSTLRDYRSLQGPEDAELMNVLLNRVDVVEELLNDLTKYFEPPQQSLEHEIYQKLLKDLRKRQDLSQEEGMINVLISTINFFSQKFDKAAFHESLDFKIESVTDKLYNVLAAMIAGNRRNCKHFAQYARLNWLVNKLMSENASTGVLEVINNVLLESPEVLNMIAEYHILAIIGLLDRNGRDPKVLDVLASLCVNKQVAVRTNQNIICENLLPRRDLLVQTALIDQVSSMRPNIAVSYQPNATMYPRWYFEVVVDQIEKVSADEPFLRIGWANDKFSFAPGIGHSSRSVGAGDDSYSWAFDGSSVWFGGRHNVVVANGKLKKNDVIGCMIDLKQSEIRFSCNGAQLNFFIKEFSIEGSFYPIVSMSALVSCRFILGENHGRLQYHRPKEYMPIIDATIPTQRITIEPCFSFGNLNRCLLQCSNPKPYSFAFVPTTIDISSITVPDYLLDLQHRLAENIHEISCMNRIIAGFRYGEVHNSLTMIDSQLVPFEHLAENIKRHYIQSSIDSVARVIACGYKIHIDGRHDERATKFIKLSNSFTQENGYKPKPVDISGVALETKFESLIDLLAENLHNEWVIERIEEGWSYGLHENIERKNSTQMLPFALLDPDVQKSNLDNASELVRLIIACGYNLEMTSDVKEIQPFPDDFGLMTLKDEERNSFRAYRLEETFSVKSGKWYYEIEIMTHGDVRVGWIKANTPVPTTEIEYGCDGASFYLFSGTQAKKIHSVAEPFGHEWKIGDVMGVMIDLHDHNIQFSMNGELLFDPVGTDVAFDGVYSESGFLPFIAMRPNQRIRFNFGHNVHNLKYFTSCGLQEGYEPFCVNMSRNVTFWYSCNISRFTPISDAANIEVHRIGASRDNPPILKVNSKNSIGYNEDGMMFRLNLPLKCNAEFRHRSSVADERNSAYSDYLNQLQEKKVFAQMTTDKFTPSNALQSDIATPVTELSVVEFEPDGQKSDKRSDKKRKIFNRLTKTNPVKSVRLQSKAAFQIQNRSLVKQRISPVDELDDSKSVDDSVLALDAARALSGFIFDYTFSVRVNPGQEPSKIAVGWTSSVFNQKNFEKYDSIEGQCTLVTDILNGGKSVRRRHSYLISVANLLNHLTEMRPGTSGVGNGIVVHCGLDVSCGLLYFYVDDVESDLKFQVEPGMVLYPSVLIKPTTRDLFQFEFGRIKHYLPYSAGCFTSLRREAEPRLPPRLHVQILQKNRWERVPNSILLPKQLKLSDSRGWSMLSDEPVQTEAMFISESNVNNDILSVTENINNCRFCHKQFQLYATICAQSNCHTAYMLCDLIDERQLMYCIQNEYMPGDLRQVFYQVLFNMFLQRDYYAKLTTSREYIVPITTGFKTRVESWTRSSRRANTQCPNFESLNSVQLDLIAIDREINQLEDVHQKLLKPPTIDYQNLISHAMTMMETICKKGLPTLRDPPGGNFQNFIVPVLKLIQRLIIMGLFKNSELQQIVEFIVGYSHGNSIQDAYEGLIHEKLGESIQLELCNLICCIHNIETRSIVEQIIEFSEDFVSNIQKDQKRRYTRLKESNLPPAMMAKRTREFRSPAKEQMQFLVKNVNDTNGFVSPTQSNIYLFLKRFHENLLVQLGASSEPPIQSNEDYDDGPSEPSTQILENFFIWILKTRYRMDGNERQVKAKKTSFVGRVADVLIEWTRQFQLHDENLIRIIYSILFKYAQGIKEINSALANTYVIRVCNIEDIKKLLRGVSIVRSLAKVQMSPDEESLLIIYLNQIIDNKIFFQHPDLIRKLSIHETVMDIMVNQLNRQKQEREHCAQGNSLMDEGDEMEVLPQDEKVEVTTTCCKLLSYFCRTGAMNQRAMFEHLSFLLDNSSMLLARPSLRGSCPLDVACASLMDNNELALALRESHLEKIASYLSRCGTTRNEELFAQGYHDIGWDPVEGERFLDFLKFCVWVNGDTVEENADLIIRLLIRRPDCLGPALREEGGGLLKAVKEGICLSLYIALKQNPHDYALKHDYETMTDEDEVKGLADEHKQMEIKHRSNDAEYIDLGAAELTFYTTLVKLMGTCAPSDEAIRMCKPSALKARSILRSLVSLDDLQGVLSARFCIGSIDSESNELPSGLQPNHKLDVLFFLERIYGISNQATFFDLFENAFLPDIRCANLLDNAKLGSTDTALALNRYLCNKVMPLMSQNSEYFANSDKYAHVIELMLQSAYRYSKCSSLTRASIFLLMNITLPTPDFRHLKPSFMINLYKQMIEDIPTLSDSVPVTLKVLTNWYERLRKYYGSKQAGYKEQKFTILLFQCIFDTLSNRGYDPDLFSRALPCMIAIACSLPPDFMVSDYENGDEEDISFHENKIFNPHPVALKELSSEMSSYISEFGELIHDAWSFKMMEEGWSYGETLNGKRKLHPNLKFYNHLLTSEREKCESLIRNALQAIVSLDYNFERVENYSSKVPFKSLTKKRIRMYFVDGKATDYSPKSIDFGSMSVTRDMLSLAQLLAKNAHEMWALKFKTEMMATFNTKRPILHYNFVPYDLLTTKERSKEERFYLNLLHTLATKNVRVTASEAAREQQQKSATNRYSLAFFWSKFYKCTFESKLIRSSKVASPVDDDQKISSRFAYSFLSKLLVYVDKAANNMQMSRESEIYSNFDTYTYDLQDVRFFTKVILPLLEKYFQAHRAYFLGRVSSSGSSGIAGVKEKEMVCSLFCKLALLLRQKFSAFGIDVNTCVRCLQVLVQSIDAFSVMKNSYEIVRASLLPFFNACAEDLIRTVNNLKSENYSSLNGTSLRGSCSLLYLNMASIPVLTSMLNHLGEHNFGSELFVNEIAIAGFKILNSAWMMGTASAAFVKRQWLRDEMDRHRPLLGECLGRFASCFPIAFFEPEFFELNENSAKLALLSPEAQDAMNRAIELLPTLPTLLADIQNFVKQGGHYESGPHIIEVVIPTLCCYLRSWYRRNSQNQRTKVSAVQGSHADDLLGFILELIGLNIDSRDEPWMKRIALDTLAIISMTNANLLPNHFVPVAELILNGSRSAVESEIGNKLVRVSDPTERENLEAEIVTEFEAIIRTIYAYLPILNKYIDLHRSVWLKSDDSNAQTLYNLIAEIFNAWASSKYFKREEMNYIVQNEIDTKTMLPPRLTSCSTNTQGPKYGHKQRKGRRKSDRDIFCSLVVSSVKRLMPIGLNMYGGTDQELIQLAKDKMVELKISEAVNEMSGEDTMILSLKNDHRELVVEYLKCTIESRLRGDDIKRGITWQSALYRKMSEKDKGRVLRSYNIDETIERIMSITNVIYSLHLVDHPPSAQKGVWRRLISSQRKKAVMACFRMAPLHSIPKHKAINLFLESYRNNWLLKDDSKDISLIDELCNITCEESYGNSEVDLISTQEEIDRFDSISQYIGCINRAATVESGDQFMKSDELYMNYAQIMSESIIIEEDDDDDDSGEAEVKSIEEQELEKQTLLSQQNRLASRGAAETVLLYISASKGQNNETLRETINLGISLLHGGNKYVQKAMLSYLKEMKDSDFFSSLANLIVNCSVLDLNIFERCMKAESLGVYVEGSLTEGNLSDSEFICSLFRFLQLLCEGHYQDFQNFLRAQAGNNSSINIVICTVDYLLSLQESMMDFYWHFSGKDSMDDSGKESFCKAIVVARQVLNTLTEYIQGPCLPNQLAIANSRLWDAISGFIFLFANLQNKLSKDPKQIELMRELLKLQKDMIIMLLSMLEGNVLNGPIGKQMVDTLIESQTNVEMILQFFDIFLKMKGLTTSDTFLEFDTNKDGFISPKEFRLAMDAQKIYTEEEIDYILMCVDANQDGKIDFIEFTERFHNPAKDIGFNMAVLLTNLSEHMPHDLRLQRLMDKARSFIGYFESSLGRIEITGSAGRIERVYFEIKESNMEQWTKPQIKDSKKQFLNSIVNETDDKEKLESFVNFCEDTIFEMQHASQISGEDESSQLAAMRARSTASSASSGIYSAIKRTLSLFTIRQITENIKSLRKYSKAQLVRLILMKLIFLIMFIGSCTLNLGKILFYCFYDLARNIENDFAAAGGRMAYQKMAVSPTFEDDLDELDNPFHEESRGVLAIKSTNSSLEDAGNTTSIDGLKKADDNGINSIARENPGLTSFRGATMSRRFLSFLALNFYTLKYLALILAFLINFMVLSYKVLQNKDGSSDYIAIDPEKSYMEYALRIVAFVHSCVSFSMLVAYYVLKVPLVIFRREKEISRKLEFDGMWIIEQPSEDDLKGKWDKIVLRSPSFPTCFWNKFVKKKVRNKYSDQLDYDDLSKMLGLKDSESSITTQTTPQSWLKGFDGSYHFWKWGVILTDGSFLYLLWYFLFSTLGNHNYFFFACHLLDIAVSIKALSTIMVSITQNGRQLLLTITLMTVVVYVYSVIAFNFFRKFYKTEDDGKVQEICTDMFSCFVFHVYHGLRAGGGIGDELESPSGDPLELYRIIFDLTFFFFVVVILLAILQGLIIDAFGELREQLDSVKETLESKCFICGIGQDYFNKEPHGFEIHTSKEHDFAAYMFFLMHIINKPDTEHTGQESYVWDQYQNRRWDFFPVGDCFRKQYESTTET
ncbi:hypothetical protein ACOME3_006297 [Neoechinorhynchus agilis]